MPGRDEHPLTIRMKEYESTWCDLRIDATIPHIVRVDGKNFSTFTKSFAQFDEIIHAGMLEAAKDLLKEFPMATTAYTHSDEISVVFPAGAANKYCDGKVCKLVSLTAAIATRGFNNGIRLAGSMVTGALFDSRIIPLPSDMEVANNIVFRARDNVRNAKMGFAQMHFPASKLHGLGADEAILMVSKEIGVVWESMPEWVRFGDVLKRGHVMVEGLNPISGKTETATRTVIEIRNLAGLDSKPILDVLMSSFW